MFLDILNKTNNIFIYKYFKKSITFDKNHYNSIIKDFCLVSIYNRYPIDNIFPSVSNDIDLIINRINIKLILFNIKIDSVFLNDFILKSYPLSQYPDYFYTKKKIVTILEWQKKQKYYTDLLLLYINNL